MKCFKELHSDMYIYDIYINPTASTISTKNTLAVKKEWPRTKKGLDKKDVKSKWAAKACVVLLLMEIKF